MSAGGRFGEVDVGDGEWGVGRGAWCVVRGAWCVVRSALRLGDCVITNPPIPLNHIPIRIRPPIAVVGAKGAKGFLPHLGDGVAAEGVESAADDLGGAVDLFAEPIVGLAQPIDAEILWLKGDMGSVVMAPWRVE